MQHKFLNMSHYVFWCLCITLCAGCNLYKYSYEKSLQQGNILVEERVEHLTTGMTQNEVTQQLGSPVVTSIFKDGRVDYVYYMRKNHHTTHLERVTLYFEDGLLQRIEKAQP